MGRLILFVGIPGSGKSSFAKTLDHAIVCPDRIRKILTGDVSNQTRNKEVWELTHYFLEEALKNGTTVVLDATNVSPIRLMELFYRYERHEIYVKLFECDIETAKARIRNDLINGIDRSAVPDYIMERMEKDFIITKDLLLNNKRVVMLE